MTEPLPAAIDAGLACLRNLAVVDAIIEAGTVEKRLRTALNASHPRARGHVPARVACAHLSAGDLTEAYFALLTAHDHLLESPR